MDLQALFDMISDTARQERARYQMTISDAITELKAMAADTPCQYEDGGLPGKAMSYRGYYSDLAFDDSRKPGPVTAGDVLAALRAVNGTVLEGYKGGDFTMADDTVIWRSEYGSASGMAWMDIVPESGLCIIKTKLIE